MYVIEMLGMCGIWLSSCLSLVASLTGKCLLVLPLSLGSLLLLRNTYAGRHVSFYVPVSILLGKCHAVSTGVLLACYSPVYQSPASPVAIARIHSLMTDTFVVGSCMPVPIS